MARVSGAAFAQSYVEMHKVRAVQFGLLNPDEIRKMSIAEIKEERIYNESGAPNYNAINDPRMGTMDKGLRCMTCKGTQAECPGHFGHIELARPVYHAGLLEYIRKVLRCVCYNCSKILAPRVKEKRDDLMKIKNNKSRFNRVFKQSDGTKECDAESGGCGFTQPKYTKNGLRIMVEHQDPNFDEAKDRKQILQPDEALKIFEKISNEECELLGFKSSLTRPEYMIIKNLAVAPPPVRPSVSMTNTLRSEDDLTFAYQKILQSNIQLQKQIQNGANQQTLNELRQNLQYYVATLMDNEIQGQPTQKHKSGKPLKAIRSRLRGKEGRLRGNLMGKRVDFSARTVITPDPNLQLDQLGVPLAIASNLTVPETVTSENIEEMRKLVNNGPNIWPGAKYIIRHDDKQIDLSAMRNRSDAHLEPGYRVERHLKDNDYVIFNRQPSLHKMSLMGHRAKVLPFSTFRLNLSATTPYNADFDGDEMNMHVPQSYETMAEIKEIMSVPNQIVSPQSNKPVMGIVQDSLLGTMLFTRKDTFLELDAVMQLLMWVKFDGNIPHPTILKPKPLWTGKQLFSLIIPNINLQKFGGDAKKVFPPDWANYSDANILIKKGELICGNVTKGVIGNSAGGMIHIIWKDHGPYPCKDFISNVQLLINNWLYTNGFTVGVQDIIARPETIQHMQEILEDCNKEVKTVFGDAYKGKLKTQAGKSMMDSFEASINQTLNSARDKAGNAALKDLMCWNRLKSMVHAGSKGSNLNISQIMACVGQQNVEGKRIPFGFHKRALPHFSKDDFGAESKGFVENCYVSGLTPQEFFFHAMGGREGLIDTAVKTAETGYIQRRLIKALEDVMVKYDGTVRTSLEQVIQFLYGEDGMAGEMIEDLSISLLKMDNNKVESTCNFLPSKMNSTQLKELLDQSMQKEVVNQVVHNPDVAQKLYEEYQQVLKDREALRTIIFKNCDDSIHLPVNVPRLLWNAKEQFQVKPNDKSDLNPLYVMEEMKKMMDSLAVIPGIQVRPDPLLIEAHENSTWLFKIYLRQLLSTKTIIQTERLSRQAFDFLLGEIKAKFEKSIVNPGEMVGPIGAQSMGEPATQMTLNTFHLAGVSAKNVTLGVPRLKEIINVAKNIKTPSMKIYMLPEYRLSEDVVNKLGGNIEYTTLSSIIKSTAIYYDPDPQHSIIKEDEELLQLYFDVPQLEEEANQKVSPWLLRIELENEKLLFKDLTMAHINRKIYDSFGEQINVIHSDDNAEKLVFRLRVNDIEDDEEETVAMYLKEFEDKVIYELALKGIHEIPKVTFTQYDENNFNSETGAFDLVKKNWLIETDGVALLKVFGFENIDFKRTVSNDLIEILKVLGIEAVRMTLINELRFVLGSYGIYVNYRHLSTLCDVMTQRGILTAITRHGINRVETGPLRKCSFEETVEILLEAAVYSEIDHLKGITENIIMGQLAPYGTGCFDLVIDPTVLQEYAQAKPDEEAYLGGASPILEDEFYSGNLTPTIPMTPNANYMQTDYSQMYTPQYQGGFSPAPGMTPSYHTPSQSYNTSGYASPGYTSPGYGRAYQTPIYQGQDYGPMQSPAPSHSPTYSPTGTARSPGYYQSYSPAYQYSSGGSSSSPVYGSTLGNNRTPTYSPPNQAGSAQYSPTAGYRSGASPAYSPNATPNYSPSYSPTQQYGSTMSPRYQVATQSRYQVDSGPSTIQGTGSNMYVPRSPAYNTSAVYETTPGARYSPIDGDSDDEEKKVNKKE